MDDDGNCLLNVVQISRQQVSGLALGVCQVAIGHVMAKGSDELTAPVPGRENHWPFLPRSMHLWHVFVGKYLQCKINSGR